MLLPRRDFIGAGYKCQLTDQAWFVNVEAVVIGIENSIKYAR